MISRVRGTEDILNLHFHNFVLSKVAHHLSRFNFTEIQTPILEQLSLFVRSLGEHTDVVSKEMYTITTESGEQLCLRPEATAPTMRAFIENGIQQIPWKVFSYGPMFRHERPQKGRWRQFSQVNIEIIGSASLAQDVLLISLLDTLFGDAFLLENYILKINFLGTKEDRELHKTGLHAFLTKHEKTLCETCRVRKEKNILRIFDCKNETCQALYRTAPKITDVLSAASRQEWDEMRSMLDLLSINYLHDPLLVRGLDYYNKTVFEFSSSDLGAQNAFCGGGRYDHLSVEIGAKQNYPSMGAALGMGRLLMLVEAVKEKLQVPVQPALNLIIPMEDKQHTIALMLAQHLTTQGHCIDILLEGASMKSMMGKANKMGARHVLIIGHDEQQAGTVTIKNMQTSESKTVKQVQAGDYL